MTRIFISYSRRDRAVADYIGAELRNRGAEVFIDYQKLTGGENFVGRLGREIEASDYFVLLLSPRSVASRWVRDETGWALHCDKPIIPVMLEPASMSDFFFLTNVEQVDFKRWSVDGKVDGAVRKLAASLGLPAEPTHAEPVPAAMVEVAPPEGEAEAEAATTPGFARGDLTELFLTAAEVADEDPEQALFLYRRILEIDPDYLQGQAQDFVEREEARLKPIRLARMQAQAETAMEAGEWRQAEQIGRDMLALETEHAEAQRIVDVCGENAKHELLYQQAVAAAEKGKWKAVDTLMRHITENCPTYGDPAGLLLGRCIPITLVRFLRERVTLTNLNDYVSPSVAFSPDGTLLAATSRDRTVRLLEMASSYEFSPLKQETRVYSISFSPNGSLLASALLDDTIKLWDVATKREITVLVGHENRVNSISFSPDGSLLASASTDTTIRLWDVSLSYNSVKDAWETPANSESRVVGRHTGNPVCVTFSPDGTLLASASDDATIKLWDTGGKRELATLARHSSRVRSVVFSPDGSLLASASADNTIKLWDPETGRELATLTGHSDYVNAVAFSPDGSLLASASDDNTIKLWDPKTGRELATLTGHSGYVHTVVFSPDGSLLASASKDNTIKLWGLG